MAGSYAPPKGILFSNAFTRPLFNGAVCPLAYKYFFLTGGLTPAPVYQDAQLTTPYTQPITADANGMFQPIYLDPSIVYREQCYQAGGALIEDVDPVQTQPVNMASSVLAAAASTSATGLAPSGLSFNILTPGVYAWEFYIEVIGTVAATTLTTSITYSGTTSLIRQSELSGPGAALFGGSVNSTATFALTTNVRGGIWFRGVINASTVGTLQLQWATNNVSNPITMNAGSFGLLRPILNKGISFTDPQAQPLAAAPFTAPQAGAYYKFFFGGTNYAAPAPVYADAGLTHVLSQIPGQAQPSTSADAAGRVSPIYLDPAIAYGVQLYSAAGALLTQLDPHIARSFEPITAVKLMPTVRAEGSAIASDQALQLTLNPGAYDIEMILEVIPSATGMSFTGLLWTAGGGGVINQTNTASSFVYEGTNGSGTAFVGQVVLGPGPGGNWTFSTGTTAGGLTRLYMRGSLTVTGGSLTLALSWNPSAGAAGTQMALNAGSMLRARPTA